MESVYESGYYVDATIGEQEDAQPNLSDLSEVAKVSDEPGVADETNKNNIVRSLYVT